MLGKELLSLKHSKLGQILCADKTGFCRLGHNFPCTIIDIYISSLGRFYRLATDVVKMRLSVANLSAELIISTPLVLSISINDVEL